MASKSVFSNAKKQSQSLIQAKCGGWAYQLTPKEALAQIAVTNCFNGTFYADATKNLEVAKEAVAALEKNPEFIAKVAKLV